MSLYKPRDPKEDPFVQAINEALVYLRAKAEVETPGRKWFEVDRERSEAKAAGVNKPEVTRETGGVSATREDQEAP